MTRVLLWCAGCVCAGGLLGVTAVAMTVMFGGDSIAAWMMKDQP